VVLALAIAMLAFLIRFNALGGSLGGFDNDEFFILTRADAILDGEQPLRDFSDGELRAAWPSLSYQVPAWTEQMWGRNLLVYAWLVCGALAVCANSPGVTSAKGRSNSEASACLDPRPSG